MKPDHPLNPDDPDSALCGDDGNSCDECSKEWFEYAMYEYHSGRLGPRVGSVDHVLGELGDDGGLGSMDRLMVDPGHYDRTIGR